MSHRHCYSRSNSTHKQAICMSGMLFFGISCVISLWIECFVDNFPIKQISPLYKVNVNAAINAIPLITLPPSYSTIILEIDFCILICRIFFLFHISIKTVSQMHRHGIHPRSWQIKCGSGQFANILDFLLAIVSIYYSYNRNCKTHFETSSLSSTKEHAYTHKVTTI